MAKQIYIDENGNPIEVSGTINNASMLPISANDSTNTKSYIDTGLAKIGTIINGTVTGSTNCPNDTVTEVGSITLDKGVYLIVACCDWGSNATGYRQIGISSVKNGARSEIATTMACNGSSKETYNQFTKIQNVTNDNTTITFYACQNSGSTLGAFPYISAVRLA